MKLAPIVPFEPITTDKYPTGEQWISQIKWDGVRILTYYDGDDVSIINRRNNHRDMQYPELVEIHQYCSADSVILDGEVIAMENGKPSFHKVMKRDSIRKESSVQTARNRVPITYMIFDVLYVNGKWVTDKSLRERQQLLENIIKQNDYVQLVKNQNDHESLYGVVVEYGLEGIVMKDLNSKYLINGKDKRWQKKKVIKDLLAVVGGVTYRSGVVNSLLLGLYNEQGELHYIGHAGTGKLTQNDWRSITKSIEKIIIQESPFEIEPSSKNVTWVQPALIVKVDFLEWTKSKTLRQPSIQTFVDRDIKECTFDQS